MALCEDLGVYAAILMGSAGLLWVVFLLGTCCNSPAEMRQARCDRALWTMTTGSLALTAWLPVWALCSWFGGLPALGGLVLADLVMGKVYIGLAPSVGQTPRQAAMHWWGLMNGSLIAILAITYLLGEMI